MPDPRKLTNEKVGQLFLLIIPFQDFSIFSSEILFYCLENCLVFDRFDFSSKIFSENLINYYYHYHKFDIIILKLS